MLSALGIILDHNTRESDTVARWGGEEFIVIAPETDTKQACALAEILRKQVAAYTFDHSEKQPMGHLSLSLGVASLSERTDDPDQLLRQADTALYRAKDTGRNRTVYCNAFGELKGIVLP